MEYIRGIDRHQLSIQSLDQLVESEAFVRIIDAFIDIIDMESFGLKYAACQKEDRPRLILLK